MKLKPAILALAAASLVVTTTQGQTSLGVGDISFISAEADTIGSVTDGYSIVSWVSLASGTVLKFTDNGMENVAGTSINNTEHAWTFTVGASSIAAGTTLNFGYSSPTSGKWNGPSSGTVSVDSAGTSTTPNPGVSTSGDQFFVYQGTGTTANIGSGDPATFTGTLVAGINFGVLISSGAAGSNDTYAPTALVNGKAWVNGGNFDNGYYNGIRTGLTNALFRAATTNLTNFDFSNTENTGFDRTTSFTITNTASIFWDANGSTTGDGGGGTWDASTADRFKNSATGTTFIPWVNSTTGNDHTAVFGGTAGTVSLAASGVTASGLTFSVSGYTIQSNNLTLAGSAPTISVTTAGHAATINSTILGSAGLTKSGAGNLTLGGNNSYGGLTTIKAGTLTLSSLGSIGNSSQIVVGEAGSSGAVLDVSAASGGFTIGATQKLSGIGTVDANASGTLRTVTIAGTHAPGNGTGVQTVDGNLTYGSGSIFEWDIASSAVGTRNSNYDGVDVSGTLGGSGSIFRIILGSGGFADAFWNQSRTWNDIFKNGANPVSIAGIFSSFQYWEGNSNVTSSVPTSQGTFSITGANLTWTAVPEASGACAGLLIAAGLMRRRRVA